MAAFQIFIDDDRYSVPTLDFFIVAGAPEARAWAQHVMVRSDHHRGVEVYRGGARLFGLGSMAGDATPAFPPDKVRGLR